MNDRLITIREVQDMIGFKSDYIYRNIKKNQFPKQIKVGSKSSRWRLSDIQKWIESQANDAIEV